MPLKCECLRRGISFASRASGPACVGRRPPLANCVPLGLFCGPDSSNPKPKSSLGVLCVLAVQKGIHRIQVPGFYRVMAGAWREMWLWGATLTRMRRRLTAARVRLARARKRLTGPQARFHTPPNAADPSANAADTGEMAADTPGNRPDMLGNSADMPGDSADMSGNSADMPARWI